jgi:hypothetical protein
MPGKAGFSGLRFIGRMRMRQQNMTAPVQAGRIEMDEAAESI